MNREIKFRAWNKDGDFTKANMMTWRDLSSKEIQEVFWHMLNGGFPDTILMQYTGLKDKNGVEIYEGDILRWTAYKKTKKLRVKQHDWLVQWSPEKLRFRGVSLLSPTAFMSLKAMGSYELVGNMYENPELLKQ